MFKISAACVILRRHGTGGSSSIRPFGSAVLDGFVLRLGLDLYSTEPPSFAVSISSQLSLFAVNELAILTGCFSIEGGGGVGVGRG